MQTTRPVQQRCNHAAKLIPLFEVIRIVWKFNSGLAWLNDRSLKKTCILWACSISQKVLNPTIGRNQKCLVLIQPRSVSLWLLQCGPHWWQGYHYGRKESMPQLHKTRLRWTWRPDMQKHEMRQRCLRHIAVRTIQCQSTFSHLFFLNYFRTYSLRTKKKDFWWTILSVTLLPVFFCWKYFRRFR